MDAALIAAKVRRVSWYAGPGGDLFSAYIRIGQMSERSAHLPNTEEKEKFNEFMIKTVLPTLPE